MKRIQSLSDTILKYSVISILASFILSIILSFFSEYENPIGFLTILVRSTSNISFLLGSIILGLGLLYAFIKKPQLDSGIQPSTGEKKKFAPKYKDGSIHQQKSVDISNVVYKTSDIPMWSDKELKFILTGLIVFLFSIISWIVYFFVFNV